MSGTNYQHRFVTAFPERLDDGILYVSVEFSTAAHRCFCGCGHEVYTRFTPRDWAISFDGDTVSLKPSIGNWSFACQSHYWLERGRVRWAERWSRERIESGRSYDLEVKSRHHAQQAKGPDQEEPRKQRPNFIRRAVNRILGR